MLNLKSGMKYRQRIEQKVSLAARQPTGELCDIDSIETEIFQDKTLDQVATEVKSYAAMENASNSKKKGKGKNKKVKRTGPSSEVFSEILAVNVFHVINAKKSLKIDNGPIHL